LPLSEAPKNQGVGKADSYNALMSGHLDVLSQSPSDARPTCGQVTCLLNAVAAGDPNAPNELFELIYDQLRAIAQRRMAADRPGHTLQATALVNEAYLRLLGKSGAAWAGRGHFFRAAAQAMRQILIDHARAHKADKRGGGRAALSISNVADLATTADPAGFLALDEAILRLEKVDALAASVVRLRFYAGLRAAEVADALGASERTVRREWAFARGWLRDALERELEQE
jgi:RNA polymerase sigma factor (TIGR02999 family)